MSGEGNNTINTPMMEQMMAMLSNMSINMNSLKADMNNIND